MTITEFLLARIAEDEAVARAMSDPDIRSVIWCAQNDGAITGDEATEQSKFVDRFSMARVLAECVAKRAIIERIPKGSDPYDPSYYTGSSALRILAAVYADHPDYLPEWSDT